MVNEAGGAGSRGVKKQVKYIGVGENDCQEGFPKCQFLAIRPPICVIH